MDRFSSLAVYPNRVLAYLDDKGDQKNVIADDLSLASNWPKFAGWLKTTAQAASSSEDPPTSITIRVGDFAKLGPEVWPRLVALGSFPAVRDELSRVLNRSLDDKAALNLIAALDDVMRVAREDDALAYRPAHLVLRLPEKVVGDLLGSELYGESDIFQGSEVEANVADPGQLAVAQTRSKTNLASDVPEYIPPRIDLLVKDPAKYDALAKVAARPSDYRHLSPALKADDDVVLASFRRDGMLLKYAPPTVQGLAGAVLVAVNEDPRAYQYSLGHARLYPPVMMAAMAEAANLPLIKPLLGQAPPEVAVAYLGAGGAFADLPKKQQNKEMVERIVRAQGYALANAVLSVEDRARFLEPFVAAHPEFKPAAHAESIVHADPAHLATLLATDEGRAQLVASLDSAELESDQREALLAGALSLKSALYYDLPKWRTVAAPLLAKLSAAQLKDFDYSTVDLTAFDRDNLTPAEVDFKKRAISALADAVEHNQLSGARDVRTFANLDVLEELHRRGISGPLVDRFAKMQGEEKFPGTRGAYLRVDPQFLAEVVSNPSWRAHAVEDLLDLDRAIAGQLIAAQPDLYDKLSAALRAAPEVLKALAASAGSFDYSLVPLDAIAKDPLLAKRVHAGLATVWKEDGWSTLKHPDVMADPAVWLATDSDDPLLKEIAALPPAEFAKLCDDVAAAKIYHFERFHSLATLRRVLNDTLSPPDGRPAIQFIAARSDETHAFAQADLDSVPADCRLVYREATTGRQVLQMIAALQNDFPLPAGLAFLAHGAPSGIIFGPGGDGSLLKEHLAALAQLRLVQPGGFVAAITCETAKKLDGFAQAGAAVFPEQHFYASSSNATTFWMTSAAGKAPRISLGSLNDFTESVDEHGLWVSPAKPSKPEALPVAIIKGLDPKSPTPRWLVPPESLDRSRMSAGDWSKWQRLTINPSTKAALTPQQKLELEAFLGTKLSDQEMANAQALVPRDSPNDLSSYLKDVFLDVPDSERQTVLGRVIDLIKNPAPDSINRGNRGNDVPGLAAIHLAAAEGLSEPAREAFMEAADAYEKIRATLVGWLKNFDLFSPGAKEANDIQQTLFAIDLAAHQLKIASPGQTQAAALRLTSLLSTAQKKFERLTDPAAPLRLPALSVEHFPVYQAYVTARTFLLVLGRGEPATMQAVLTLDQDIEAIGSGKPGWADLAAHVQSAQRLMQLDLSAAAQKQPVLASLIPGISAVQAELAKGFNRGVIGVDVLEEFSDWVSSAGTAPVVAQTGMAAFAAQCLAWLEPLMDSQLTDSEKKEPSGTLDSDASDTEAGNPQVDERFSTQSIAQRARRVMGEALFGFAQWALTSNPAVARGPSGLAPAPTPVPPRQR